jgi:ABC-type sugar transport system permease subunit
MTATAQKNPGGAAAPPGQPTRPTSIASWIIRLGALAIIDAFAIWLVYMMIGDGIWALAAVLALVTLAINIIFLRDKYFPLRWVSPGLALMVIFVAYPILFTVYISFTNYGDGHLLTKQQNIAQFESQVFLPEDAELFNYTAYRNAEGEFMLWLAGRNGSEPVTVTPGGEPVARQGEPPATLDGYEQVPQNRIFTLLTELAALTFGTEEDSYKVSQQQFGVAAKFEPLYVYDAATDTLTNQQTGVVYTAVNGTWTAPDGSTLQPGFVVTIGGYNYARLFTDPALREPFIAVFIWTVVFALLSVIITFFLGMLLAIVFDVPEMPFRRLLRSLLLIPYAIPAFVSVPVWVGLLNPEFGIISLSMKAVFGWSPAWFADPFWAKVGILLIQLWLGMPYMFVIVTGALQSLPTDVYEAADLDGANALHKWWSITMPLLLITVGPLLVASFAFNFNNFTVIQLYNNGGPPMVGTASPVGHTDILATYTYRIAFASARGSDQGYAAAITVIIFLILVAITFFQFRYTNMLEERSENV